MSDRNRASCTHLVLLGMEELEVISSYLWFTYRSRLCSLVRLCNIYSGNNLQGVINVVYSVCRWGGVVHCRSLSMQRRQSSSFLVGPISLDGKVTECAVFQGVSFCLVQITMQWHQVTGSPIGTGSRTFSLTFLSRLALTAFCQWTGTGMGEWYSVGVTSGLIISLIGGLSIRGRA